MDNMEGEGGTISKGRDHGHGHSHTKCRIFKFWLGGTKMAKEDIIVGKALDGCYFFQYHTTKTIVKA